MANPRILLVDGQERTLAPLLKPLRTLAEEGEIILVDSGEDARGLMDRERFHVVISDLHLSDMNGAQLFKHLRQQHPASIRILVSDPHGSDKVLQSVSFAHRSLARTCSVEDLWQVIQSAARLRQRVESKKVRRHLNRISALPTLPQIYYELVDELQAEDPAIKSIAAIIVKDVAITTKLLQIVNSAYFSLPTRVTTPLQTVTLLGMDKISDLTLAASVFTMFAVPPIGGLNVQTISSHCLQIGSRAKSIATRLKMPEQVINEAMLAGIVHDVGKLLELAYLRPQLKAALERSRREAIPLHLAEQEEFGASHGQIGAYLLSLWGLPDSLITAAAYHHEPMRAGKPQLGVLTAIHLANGFCRDGSLTSLDLERCGLDRDYLDQLQLTDRLEELRDIDLVPQG